MDQEIEDIGGSSGSAPTSSDSSTVSFDEDYTQSGRSSGIASGLTQWVIDHSGGAIQDESQANYVLIGVAVLALGVSLFFFFSGGSSVPSKSNVVSQPPAGQ